jgi:hypothetical protein
LGETGLVAFSILKLALLNYRRLRSSREHPLATPSPCMAKEFHLRMLNAKQDDDMYYEG